MAGVRQRTGSESKPGKPKKVKERAKPNYRTVALSLGAAAVLLVSGGLAYLIFFVETERDAFVYYSAYAPQSLDPADAYDLGSRLPIENIYDKLVKQSGSEPELFEQSLATSWTISDDGLWYNFSLRTGVRFSNGNGFNSSDVLFTIERVIKMGSPDTGTSSLISDCIDLNQTKTMGGDAISVRLLRPTAPFLSYLSQAFPLAIVDREYVLSHYAPNDPYAHDYLREHPLGTGPYKLADWDPGKELTLLKNRAYWGGWEGEHPSKIILRFQPSDTERLDAMQKGHADAVEIPSYLSSEVDPTIGIDVVHFDSARVEVVAMNFKPLMGGQSFMTDPQVRKAFSFAFDYTNISLRSYSSALASMSGYIPPAAPFASESQPNRPFMFNLTMASELLNASGRGLDSNGYRFNGSAIKLAYEPGSYARESAARQFASDLQRLGAKVDVFETDRPGPTVGRAWDLFLVSLDAWYLDPEYFATALAASSSAGGDVFRTGESNAVIDASVAQASLRLERDARIANYGTVWHELSISPNMIYVGQTPVTLLVGEHVDVVYVHPITMLDLYQTREA